MTTNNKTNRAIEFTDATDSRKQLMDMLNNKQSELQQLAIDSDPLVRANLQYEIGEIMLDINNDGMKEAAWGLIKEAFMINIENQCWEQAVLCTDALYRADLDASVVALGNGIWLAVTFPIDPELSIIMLKNLIDDTPTNSDGAAVAAATAHYIADLRLEGEKRESTLFLTRSLLGNVAERHSQVSSQEAMNSWMTRLELNDANVFLPRLASVLEAIVNNTWWYDKDKLRQQLPVN